MRQNMRKSNREAPTQEPTTHTPASTATPQQQAATIRNTLLWLHSKYHDDNSIAGEFRNEWNAMARILYPQAEDPALMLSQVVHPMFGREE